MPDNYLFDIPLNLEVEQDLQAAIELWKPRNQFIADMRDMLSGKNKIKAPESTQYQVRVAHTYALAAVINEKLSRFTHQPNIQVIPYTHTERSRSTRLEQALFSIFFEIERNGDGDVWSRVVHDAITLDEGVELIEAAPAAFWPEMVAEDEDGNLIHPMEQKEKDQYKKERGVPVRTSYVPLEYFLPIYENNTLVKAFHLETRSLQSVLRNSLFDTSALQAFRKGNETDIRTQVVIVRYCNQDIYAYYALTPSSTRVNQWPSLRLNMTGMKGPLVLLHAFEHGRGKVIYNPVAGRFGGWKTADNRIEPIGRAMMDINQKLDELLSQSMTNIGARYWPNLAFYLDPDRRGWAESGETPKAPRVQPGEPLLMYTGEELRPVFEPRDDPMFLATYQQLYEQLGRLGGSAVLFGGREPGVDTGYHQALMISRAEHLDEKLEQHLVQGAIQRATHIFDIVKSIKERVWSGYIEREAGTNNKKMRYHYIDPNDLQPVPVLDARVRKTRPVDFIAAMRTALDASVEREGKGPLLSDDTIREELLGRDSPDIEERKILFQTEKTRIVNSGVIDRAIIEQLNLKLAQASNIQPNQEELANADPALQQAVGMVAGQNPPGGINPATLSQNGMGRRKTGTFTGDAQPEARLGEEVAGAANAGLIP